MGNPRSSAASVREQKLARVIDREVAPIWHDRFARMLMRELPNNSGTFVLDIHSGPGHTTAELLQRLDESSRVVALGRDPWLMQVSKTRVRPEWKRRVYFKSGDIDDVPGMNEATYDLAIANLVLGEQVVDWQTALSELVRVTKPGGQVLATLPLHDTWQEVEDLFEELLRDEGMRKEVATLQKLRRRRPKPSQIVAGLQELGVLEDDYVLEHERFELLFRSGREFLFAPVIEHGPLRLWKAIIGRSEKPQALFWRFKEAIDTYYAGHVLAVSVIAGLIRVRVPSAGAPSFAAEYWSRYPSLNRLWGGPGAEAAPDEESFDLDIDMDMDVDVESGPIELPSDSGASLPADSGIRFADTEVSGLVELPAVEDASLGEDPFAGLLEELDAEAAAAAEIAAEDAEVEAVQPRVHTQTGKAATLGALGDNSSGLRSLPTAPRKPGDSGVGRAPRKPGDSGVGRAPRKPGDSGTSPISAKLPGRKPGDSGISAKLPGMRKPGDSGVGKIPRKPGTPPLATPAKPAKTPRAAPPPKIVTPPAKAGPGKPRAPVAAAKPTTKPTTKPTPKTLTGPQPLATKPGEDDPFASMLTDDEDEIEEFDEFDEFASLVDGEVGEDEDLADAFGEVAPDPEAGRSGTRPLPPPPPIKPPGKKK